MIVAGFLLFQFMINFGPNATTHLMAGELFPTKMRGLGAGFAATNGKGGAVVGWLYRIEPKGRDMETI